MPKLFCISDAHLGAQSAEKESHKATLLNSFLEFILKSENDLLICGDLFDFWFEYRHAVPKLHFRTLALLADISHSGRKIHYLAGNHDFWLGSFLEQQIGLLIHKDDFSFEYNGKSIYAFHGDGLYKKDYLYRGLKKVLRHPFNIFLYRLLHPDFGIPLALHFSHQSRESKSNKTKYSDRDYRDFAFDRINEGHDYVVLGHTHWPAMELNSGGWYLNAGNWIDAFTFIEIGDKPGIYRWDGAKGVEWQLTLPPGN
jgi:UDP-2,3-diacylglucosamine hydrolase